VRSIRLSPRAYQRVTLFALLALGFIIVTGAAVRLTGSGLGCSEWPNCENGQLVAPLEVRPMIEFVNRTITGIVSVIVILAVLGSLVRVPRRRDLTWWSLGLVAGVVGQIVLGGYTVKFGLKPQLVTAHFLVSIVLVWNGMVLHHRAGGPGGRAHLVVEARLRAVARALLALSALVLVTGTVVTATGPHAGDASAPRYDLAITDVARVHSLTVWTFLAVSAFVLWRLAQTGAPRQLDTRARRLVGAIVLQGALGYFQYVAGVPPYLVILHVLGSVLVFVATLDLYLHLFARPADAPIPADADGAASRRAPDPELV
jgi:cytochrome c oxidase assembly protein subunit 15